MRPRAARRFAAVLLLMLCWAPCVPRDALAAADLKAFGIAYDSLGALIGPARK